MTSLYRSLLSLKGPKGCSASGVEINPEPNGPRGRATRLRRDLLAPLGAKKTRRSLVAKVARDQAAAVPFAKQKGGFWPKVVAAAGFLAKIFSIFDRTTPAVFLLPTLYVI